MASGPHLAFLHLGCIHRFLFPSCYLFYLCPPLLPLLRAWRLILKEVKVWAIASPWQ